MGSMTASKVLNPGVLTSAALVALFVLALRTSLWYTNTHVGERFFSGNLAKTHTAATAAAALGGADSDSSVEGGASPKSPVVTSSDLALGCAELANNGYWTSRWVMLHVHICTTTAGGVWWVGPVVGLVVGPVVGLVVGLVVGSGGAGGF